MKASGRARPIWAIAAMLSAFMPGQALADVKDGVDAWTRGDYAAAVREWEGPAEAGDPDAMFNLGQAYRLGRGVPMDTARAEQLYARAAALGHVRAADTYGLMLFQDGRRTAALPYVQDAARRGDPRSQYLLGIAHFNGDIVPRDWIRAYALVTLANSTGLPQAAPALAQMDQYIPLQQRQQAASLAVDMRREAEAEQARQFAAVDLGGDADTGVTSSAAAARPAPSSSMSVPRPIPTTAISPSVAAARAAIEEARSATGTNSPVEAGATYARGEAPASSPPVRQRAEARSETAPAVASRPAKAERGSAPWAVQLGAFSVSGNADRLWTKLSGRAELAGARKELVPSGRVTRLLATGYPSQADANAACRALKKSGQDCLVTRP